MVSISVPSQSNTIPFVPSGSSSTESELAATMLTFKFKPLQCDWVAATTGKKIKYYHINVHA